MLLCSVAVHFMIPDRSVRFDPLANCGWTSSGLTIGSLTPPSSVSPRVRPHRFRRAPDDQITLRCSVRGALRSRVGNWHDRSRMHSHRLR
jgi:hypothetical protein